MISGLPDLTPSHHPEPLDVTPGEATDCATDCDLHNCLICGERVCPEHDPDISECAENGGYHHADSECEWRCIECQYAAFDDRMHEIADEIRKERG